MFTVMTGILFESQTPIYKYIRKSDLLKEHNNNHVKHMECFLMQNMHKTILYIKTKQKMAMCEIATEVGNVK